MILVSSRVISKHFKPEQAANSHIYVISGFGQKRHFQIGRSETFLSQLKVKQNWHTSFVNIVHLDYMVSSFRMLFWGVEYPCNSFFCMHLWSLVLHIFFNLHFLNFVLSHMSHNWKLHKKSLWHQSSYLIASRDKYLPLCKLILYVQLFSSGVNLIVYLIASLVLTWILYRTHSIFIFITAIILSHSALDNISEKLLRLHNMFRGLLLSQKRFLTLTKDFQKI